MKTSSLHVLNTARRPVQHATLTALVSASLLASGSAFAQTTSADSPEALSTVTVTGTNLYENVGYTRRTTSAGTGLTLTQKELPQAISIVTEQRIQDQNLDSIESVLSNTTGISVRNVDSDRVSFASRGFRINSFQYDGIPTLNRDNRWYFGEGRLNTAIYDRVEVIRGANGLTTGSGNPGASINFVRKHADSRELTGSISGTVGSWDKRGTTVDVTTPLTASGNVRARFIGGYEEGGAHLDRQDKRRTFGYGIIDADVTESTTLSLGFDYQDSHTSSPTWGGLPLWFSDGTPTNYSRSFSVAPDWSYYDFESEKVFAEISHRFDNDWQVRVVGAHEKTDMDGKLAYPYVESTLPDQMGAGGVTFFTGWNRGHREVDSVDVQASGPFALLGREHELVIGGNYSDQTNNYENTFIDGFTVDDFNSWDGSAPNEGWAPFTPSEASSTRQKAVYTASRFSLADPLTLIVGARYTEWEGMTQFRSLDQQSKYEVTPYGGLVYDFNNTYSAFASYTEIFEPQNYLNVDGTYLDPVVGKNYETGLKAAWLNGLLNGSFSVFRIEQENVAAALPMGPGQTETFYTAAEGVVSEGFEVELSGAVTDDLDMTVGYSHFTAKTEDDTLNINQPRSLFNLFASYNVPQKPELTVGGGVNWQSSLFAGNLSTPAGIPTEYEQDSYTLANLFGRYQFTPELSLQVNVKNLFDEKYYSNVGGYGVYGEPRSISSTLRYAF
ncbi:MAG: ferric-rhodotorulic acid/ferric-coprogen receptor FhuE [Halomonadaceae bacterium]|uniref:Ferric-rhodotorulic acid/ferric-coprogen receptor FhuE n=1 Tax=Halomonas colorata TaxID=2742615 RepID=A0ABR9FWJ7_9GAMM|nr:ferric-rhodotorulic acid/ferric-coprogen receptor FhuE [Halomonas colorata]MBE0463002.1 ferric-rhodotorulic acid/ferric-coprogen receptor FhuE [Halomonas colorata]